MKKKRVLLMLVPFWTPMIPPMGICSLKRFLKENGYDVFTYDLNVDYDVRDYYHNYFNTLAEYIPENKRSNFYSIGHHVLRNHMSTYLNCNVESEYYSLLELFLKETFYIDFNKELLLKLNDIIKDFFIWLERYIIQVLEEIKPHIFGLTIYRDTLPASIFAYQLVKKYDQNITTLMGGAIFSEQFTIGSPDMEFFLKISEPYLDKIFIGQGEKLLLNYLEDKFGNDKRIFNEKDLDKIVDFESLDIPDYSDIELDKYLFMGATSSSGCKYQCSFCNVMKYYGPFRSKNPIQTVDEIIKLNKLYGFQQFYLTDHMLNSIITSLSAEFVKRETAIYWTGYLRVDDEGLDLNKVFQWRKGGFYCARLGIESGSQKVLDLIGKKITPEKSKKMISNLAEAGIKTTTYWFVGHPGETEEDFQKTLDLLNEMKDDIYEAESDYFNYHYDGQTDSNLWAEKRKLVFPESAKKYTITQTWTVDCEPSREIIFNRLNRFVEHCKKLGIPNPYSSFEIYMADERWKNLHPNSVPPLVEFEKGSTIDDRNKFLISEEL